MWIPLIVFVLCYLLFGVFPYQRSIIACGGALLLILTGTMSWQRALIEHVHWNVITLFFGTLVLADLFMQSRMPAVLAEFFIDQTRTTRGAMIAVCTLSGLLSAFVENVAIVLLVSPVALSLAEKLKISPVKLLIGITTCANLQGTATLIGDPPSMILAGYMKMNFNDFFFYHGKPGIFFAVQVGAIFSTLVLAWIFRGDRQSIEMIPQEKVRSWFPTGLMILLIVGLATTSVFDPDFKWLAGTLTIILAFVGLVWFHFIAKWGSAAKLMKAIDWDTTIFLLAIFIVVGGLSTSGWLDKLSAWISMHFGSTLLTAFVTIVTVSVVISAFVDNVPFLLAMIPVTEKVANALEAPLPLLMFGLLIGSCLGGNITPIGASANVVTIGMLKKQGYAVSFKEFMGIGIPFTFAAVISACCFVWLVWAP